jgi:hypothetical protein
MMRSGALDDYQHEETRHGKARPWLQRPGGFRPRVRLHGHEPELRPEPGRPRRDDEPAGGRGRPGHHISSTPPMSTARSSTRNWLARRSPRCATRSSLPPSSGLHSTTGKLPCPESRAAVRQGPVRPLRRLLHLGAAPMSRWTVPAAQLQHLTRQYAGTGERRQARISAAGHRSALQAAPQVQRFSDRIRPPPVECHPVRAHLSNPALKCKNSGQRPLSGDYQARRSSSASRSSGPVLRPGRRPHIVTSQKPGTARVTACSAAWLLRWPPNDATPNRVICADCAIALLTKTPSSDRNEYATGTHIYAPGGIFKCALGPCRRSLRAYSQPFVGNQIADSVLLVTEGFRGAGRRRTTGSGHRQNEVRSC